MFNFPVKILGFAVALVFVALVFCQQEESTAQYGCNGPMNSPGCNGYASSGPRGGLFSRIAYRRGQRRQARISRLTQRRANPVNIPPQAIIPQETAEFVQEYVPYAVPVTQTAAQPVRRALSTPIRRYVNTSCANGVCTIQQYPSVPYGY